MPLRAASGSWETDRDAAANAAFTAAYTAHAGRPGPERDAIAREAASAAGQFFEWSTPPPTGVNGEEIVARYYTDRDRRRAAGEDPDPAPGAPR